MSPSPESKRIKELRDIIDEDVLEEERKYSPQTRQLRKIKRELKELKDKDRLSAERKMKNYQKVKHKHKSPKDLFKRLNKIDQKYSRKRLTRQRSKKINPHTDKLETDEEYHLRKNNEKNIELGMEEDIKKRFHELQKNGGRKKRRKKTKKKKKKRRKTKKKR